jgi:hypothetical protein
MSTLNGIGTTLLGIGSPNDRGERTATRWVTFLYAPIVPLNRYTVRFLPYRGSGFHYEILAEEKLAWNEIALTYLYGWLLFPLLIFWPMPIAVIEVWQWLKLPAGLHTPFIVFTIVWLLTAVWKLSDWHEKRGRPSDPSNNP